MIAEIVVFWLAGSRHSPDRASDLRDWWYRGGPAADEETRTRSGTLVPRAPVHASCTRPSPPAPAGSRRGTGTGVGNGRCENAV